MLRPSVHGFKRFLHRASPIHALAPASSATSVPHTVESLKPRPPAGVSGAAHGCMPSPAARRSDQCTSFAPQKECAADLTPPEADRCCLAGSLDRRGVWYPAEGGERSEGADAPMVNASWIGKSGCQ
jgi:hypothetical protein